MKLLYECERILYFQEVYRRYGRPVDFQFLGDKRIYFFKNGRVLTIIEEGDGRYIVEESKAGLWEVFKKRSFY